MAAPRTVSTQKDDKNFPRKKGQWNELGSRIDDFNDLDKDFHGVWALRHGSLLSLIVKCSLYM